MKLQEALAERKALGAKIDRLEDRLETSARSYKDENPAESVDDLRRQVNEALNDWEKLVLRINLTNVEALVPGTTMTITEAIAHRDRLQREIKVLNSIIKAARPDRLYGDERRASVVHVNVSDLQQELDDKSKELRLLDNQIQRANFEVELPDEETV